MKRGIFKIIDANLNRVREGLRVCEDIARFALGSSGMARSLKLIRHAATNALLDSGKMRFKDMLRARDVQNDGMKFTDFERHIDSGGFSDIFMANIERVKESLRVLEECCKIIDESASRKYRRQRFNAYEVEKKFMEKAFRKTQRKS